VTALAEVAGPLAGICVPVPAADVAGRICVTCHTRRESGFDRCLSCRRVEAQVTRPCPVVVPVSLYEVRSQLHHYLRGYKSVATAPGLRREFSMKVAALLCHFLRLHRGCIASAGGGDWSVMTCVPSSAGRSGEHPLVGALRAVPEVFASYEELLGVGGAGVGLGHNLASDDGFVAGRRLDGERVLVVDDTFTTGARAQSAASALTLAGAEVVAIVPVGRVVDPGWEHVGAWWAAWRRRPFTFDTCCLDA